MKTQLQKIVAQLQTLSDRANDILDNSESDITIERYETLVGAMDDAITLLDDAIAEAYP
jgi:hypothetical protein